MRVSPWLLLGVVSFVPAAACQGEDTNVEPDTDTDTDTDSDTDADADTDVGDETLTGDLSEGETLSSLKWAQVTDWACWPSTEDVNFNGNHVFFEVSKENLAPFVARVVPDAGVDVSLYLLEFIVEPQYPPDVTNAERCESAADFSGDSNPGESEEANLQLAPERSVLVGVAGANGAKTGGFTLKIFRGP